MKLTPSQSVVNGPTFAKYELCRRFGRRSLSEITHGGEKIRCTDLAKKLAKPSLESCKAMKGAVCKRSAAW